MDSTTLQMLSSSFRSKLMPIKVFLFDVDGILTNGSIYYAGEDIGFNRFFSVLDGYGMKILKDAGFKVGLITGGDSIGVFKRSEYLELDYTFVGEMDKRKAWNKVKEDGYENNEILYMGDELFDIPLLRAAGFAATVPNASLEVTENVDYITDRQAGYGAVREVIDIFRYVHRISPHIPGFDEL